MFIADQQIWCQGEKMCLCCCCTFGTNCKNPPKITFEKIVKLSGHTCVCNNLTSFECEVHKNRKRKWCKSAENCFEKLVKSHQVNLFLAYFTHLKPQCAAVDFNGAILTKNVKTQRELGLPWTVRILVVIRSASVPRSSLVVIGEEKIGNLFKMFLIYVPIQYPE